jgi:hypothetical protein
MTKEQKAIDKLTRELTKLMYNFGVQTIVLGGAVAILNQEVPDFKERLITVLESTAHPSDVGQAMIDEAIDYAKTNR